MQRNRFKLHQAKEKQCNDGKLSVSNKYTSITGRRAFLFFKAKRSKTSIPILYVFNHLCF